MIIKPPIHKSNNSVFIILLFCSFFLNYPSIAQSANNPYVKVQGRQLFADFTGNGNYDLAHLYVIRGVDYSPIPIGRYSSDWGYNPPNNLPNNMFADTNILNRD